MKSLSEELLEAFRDANRLAESLEEISTITSRQTGQKFFILTEQQLNLLRRIG